VTVQDNTVSAYDSMGILAQGAVGTVMIHDNSFTGDPGSVGIVIFGDVVTTVADNSATGGTNGGAGINVNGVQYAVVTRNHLSGNDYGIQIFTQEGAQLRQQHNC
jgi:nitrous oxidase accessory protein NosD